jgi:hypothetical protein
MSRLYLRCGLCGHQQADGLLSRGHWGHLDVGNGSAVRACPRCKTQHTDWEDRLRSLGPEARDASAFGGGYNTSYGIR